MGVSVSLHGEFEYAVVIRFGGTWYAMSRRGVGACVCVRM